MARTIIALLFIILFYSCDTSDPVVGSTGDTAISNVSFVVDTTYLNNSTKQMVAQGIARNNGSAGITSPWYIEAQFYTDAAKITKLGGNSTQIGVPLSRNQQTIWTITFSSSQVDLLQYPNFAVGDIRAIYK